MGLHSYIVNVCGKVVMFYLFVLAGQGQEMGYGSSVVLQKVTSEGS